MQRARTNCQGFSRPALAIVAWSLGWIEPWEESPDVYDLDPMAVAAIPEGLRPGSRLDWRLRPGM